MYYQLRKYQMLLKQKTNHLFYGKWPYKITCMVPCAHLIRTFGNKGLENPELIVSRNFFNTEDVKVFVKEFKELLQDPNVKRRINYNHIDFYILSKEEFIRLRKELKKYIVAITQPDNDEQLTTLLENKKYILCDKLPHGKYHYKITFKDMAPNIRRNLIEWAEKYNNDDIYVPKSTKNHFKCIKYHHGSHYFYIKDSKMITLITLASAGHVRRTDEYVVRTLEETA